MIDKPLCPCYFVLWSLLFTTTFFRIVHTWYISSNYILNRVLKDHDLIINCDQSDKMSNNGCFLYCHTSFLCIVNSQQWYFVSLSTYMSPYLYRFFYNYKSSIFCIYNIHDTLAQETSVRDSTWWVLSLLHKFIFNNRYSKIIVFLF